MTHTSTEQPEAEKLARIYEGGCDIDKRVAAELRRLHARVQELEASQALRVPHNKTHAYEDHKKYPGACRHCRYAENEPLQHGITQEKQG